MKWVVMFCVLLCATVALADTPEKALCVVCAANGETELEKVEATREHDGKTYYFCSKKCAGEFDANPAAYVLEVAAAPSATWKTTAGEALSLESLRGKVVLVDFWATWCKPCIKELPHLQRIYEKYSPKGLSLLAISTDSPKTESQVKPFVLGKKYTFTVLLDPSQEIFKALQGKGAMPYTVIIDAEGNIRYRHTGYRPGDENELERVVVELMGGSAPEESSTEPSNEEPVQPNGEKSAG